MGEWLRIASTTLALALGGSGADVRADELPGSMTQPSRRSNPTAQANRIDDSQVLRKGVVTAVSPRGEKVEIQGHWHRIDPRHTRLFRSGRPVDVDALKTGQVLAFTLWHGQGDRETLGVVYVP